MLSGTFYAFLHFVPPKSVNLGGHFCYQHGGDILMGRKKSNARPVERGRKIHVNNTSTSVEKRSRTADQRHPVS